jgi:hypothetical protein
MEYVKMSELIGDYWQLNDFKLSDFQELIVCRYQQEPDKTIIANYKDKFAIVLIGSDAKRVTITDFESYADALSSKKFNGSDLTDNYNKLPKSRHCQYW